MQQDLACICTIEAEWKQSGWAREPAENIERVETFNGCVHRVVLKRGPSFTTTCRPFRSESQSA